MADTFQIVQVRYSAGALIEDTWPVLYAIDAQAIEAFKKAGPERMFEDCPPDADYFIRGLDRNGIATGEHCELSEAA